MTSLADEVLAANLALPRHGLVTLTWGNASGVDRAAGEVIIKPSGVEYEQLTVDDLSVVDLATGRHLSGGKPSTDTPTHLALFRAFEEIGGIVHTHSPWASAWAQAQQEIPLYGTTHADLCASPIPLTRALTPAEIDADYEGSTGTVLIEAVTAGGGPAELPCVLVRGHAPFCWGADPRAAVEIAVTLEQVARMALLTRLVDAAAPPLAGEVRDKHHQRKHGPDAYYGQP
jgi:L-ribulose-5-phosphate 4-epimerase